jgi:hypothetical protein
MRAREFTVTEAISVSHIKDVIPSAMEAGILAFLSDRWLDSKIRDLPPILNSHWVDTMEIFDIHELRSSLIQNLSNHLRVSINAALADQYSSPADPGDQYPIGWVAFEKMRAGGTAWPTGFTINVDLLQPVIKQVKEQLLDYLISSGYVGSLRADDEDLTPDQRKNLQNFYRVDGEGAANNLVNLRADLADRIMDQIQRRSPYELDGLIGTIVHEVVHVIQHRAQKGRDIEYRSYLGKKDEFKKVASNPDRYDDPEWARLYYSSPQEIAAFAHNMAQDVLSRYGRNPEVFSKNITAKDFVYALRHILGNQYKEPSNARERAVLKRYLKLAYQEVQRYIERRQKQAAADDST